MTGTVPIDVVGLTARGWAELTAESRQLISAAEVVIGSRRQVGLVHVHDQQHVLGWPSPLRAGLPALLESVRGHRTVALASGDPLVSGIGSTLIETLGAENVRIHPAMSSVALARARLGWTAETCDVVSVVGRDLDRVRRYLYPGSRTVILSATADTPAALAALAVEVGLPNSRLTVLGDLGSDVETRRTGLAREWSVPSPTLNVIGVECVTNDPGTSYGWTPGLPDDAYEHDGQLTKRDLRASALAQLAPRPGEYLWDVGAGAGSIGIEWSRTHPRCRAVAVERDPARSVRIRRNAARLGVPELEVVTGAAPDALTGLTPPNAIFVGGGAIPQTLDHCWSALRRGGRLVVHAVTVETEQLLHDHHRRHGGTLTRVSVETLEPIGRYTGWRPARAVVQWSATKGPPGPT